MTGLNCLFLPELGRVRCSVASVINFSVIPYGMQSIFLQLLLTSAYNLDIHIKYFYFPLVILEMKCVVKR